MNTSRVKKPSYYEIYRDDEKWMTVMTFLDVVNFVFKDFQITGGVYEYSFKEFYLCPRVEK